MLRLPERRRSSAPRLSSLTGCAAAETGARIVATIGRTGATAADRDPQMLDASAVFETVKLGSPIASRL